MMLHTAVCDLLGIDYPIVCAPMGFVTGVDLASAVSGAGGFGIFSHSRNPPELLRRRIRRMRERTDRPFGVNLLLVFDVDEQVEVCIEERVPALSFFWGDPSRFVARAHDAGVKVIHQVGSVEEAERAAKAGVDAIIAQGFEAGGHVAGSVTTMALVPRVVDAVSPVPVLASGGIADARGLVAALALGAAGISIGTRFLATPEATAHPRYKERVLAASEEETVYTTLFGYAWPNAPHRTLRTKFVQEWIGREAAGQEQRKEPIIGTTRIAGEVVPVPRFMVIPPSRDATGDIDSMDLLAGQSVGLVREIKPAAEIVRELVDGARRIIGERLAATIRD